MGTGQIHSALEVQHTCAVRKAVLLVSSHCKMVTEESITTGVTDHAGNPTV